MPSFLFVCTANLYRSPLAAALFRRKLQSNGKAADWNVESAGTWAMPGESVPKDFLKTASAMDIDLRNHKTRQVDADLLARCDLILVMEGGQKEALTLEFPAIRAKIHLLSRLADGMEYDIADPVNSDLSLEEIASELLGLIDRAYPKICQLAVDHLAQDV